MISFLISLPAHSKVFGYDHDQILKMDRQQYNGTACSHKNNDFGNRWCHAMFTKMMNNYSMLLGPAVFAAKEYAVDKNPSKADIAIVEVPVYKQLNVTIFGDGMTVFSIDVSY